MGVVKHNDLNAAGAPLSAGVRRRLECYRWRAMRARVRHTGLALVLAFMGSTSLRRAAAEESPPSRDNYLATFVGTTLGYKPPVGSWEGWQHDWTTLVGYGRQLRPTLALELDLGPTWASGRYSSFALTPGLVWSFHPNVYAAARFAVPVDPELNLVLLPGVGVAFPHGRVMPTLEVNLSSAVGRGDPDLGVTLTAGLLVFF